MSCTQELALSFMFRIGSFPFNTARPIVEPSCTRLSWVLAAIMLGYAASAHAAVDNDTANSSDDSAAVSLDRVEVVGRRQGLVGEAISASEGIVAQADMADRALLRTGDLLEMVPGLIATSHSGSGKANQYFLRGFNLDHGTDFSTYVDGMPVNMRSHAHGQGYTDLNFLIPEAVAAMTYRKGPYYADVGDFSATGTARFQVADSLDHGQLTTTVGEDGYDRIMLADSVQAGPGEVLYAGEVQRYDGPWTQLDEDVRKRNALLRYSQPLGGGRGHVMLMGYRNTWNSPDQIPQRAVSSGLISDYGSLDTALGGDSSRYSLSAGWQGPAVAGQLDVSAYVIDYSLKLWSNPTYFLDDPTDGDQLGQFDERRVYGAAASQEWDASRSRWRVGLEGRVDDIDRVALMHTINRAPSQAIRDDQVEESSLGLYAANEFDLSDKLRAYLGLRHDWYSFQVRNAANVNGGKAHEGITSYKASLAYQLADPVELYAGFGTGFHSNGSRGALTVTDPISGDPAEPVDPLVRSKGAELGARFALSEQLRATLALWSLRLDSELLFIGDAGTTQATRPTKREGGELGVYWFPNERYSANLEVSYTDVKFSDVDPAGDRVPGAIPLVIGAGVTAHYASGWLASMQLRHFGHYPLIEDNSVQADGSTMVNLRLGREWKRWGVYLDVLNALDSRDHDVEYFYASRLPGEPAEGVEDSHFHIFPPRSLRASLRLNF